MQCKRHLLGSLDAKGRCALCKEEGRARALTRNQDWARRIAVIVVALAAAAATFFLFSPMARCAVPICANP